MQAELLGYLLNALEDEEVLRIEQLLEADEAVRRQLDVLRLALVPLGTEKQHDEPPQGLGSRTCKLVEKVRRDQSSQLD